MNWIGGTMATKKTTPPQQHICYLCNKEILPEEKFEFVQTRRRSKLYMLVSSDKYELPLAVADTTRELSVLIGVREDAIRSAMSKARKRGSKCRYVKVVIEEEEK